VQEISVEAAGGKQRQLRLVIQTLTITEQYVYEKECPRMRLLPAYDGGEPPAIAAAIPGSKKLEVWARYAEQTCGIKNN
jgi:hypothetical protein